MEGDLSVWSLFLQASVIVKAIMVLLLLFSVISWAMIVQRSLFMRRAARAIDQFEDQFWSGTDLSKLYESLVARGTDVRGVAHIFQAGFKEFARLRKQAGVVPAAIMNGVQRSMRVALSRENDKLETNLSFLATVASTSPYIGLFGTVWGIMHSFIALGGVQQATIAMVAPGIAEALIATAMGLFAAIPAMMAYNRYSTMAQRLQGRYETFQDEFASILHRQAHATPNNGDQAAA